MSDLLSNLNDLKFSHNMKWNIVLILLLKLCFNFGTKNSSEEFISVDPTVRKKISQQRLKVLEETMKVATELRSTGFAAEHLTKAC